MRSRRTAGSREVATGIWNRVGCAAGGALHEGTRAAFPSRTGQALSLPTVRRAYVTNAPNHRRRYAANRTLASGGTRRSVGALLAAPGSKAETPPSRSGRSKQRPSIRTAIPRSIGGSPVQSQPVTERLDEVTGASV